MRNNISKFDTQRFNAKLCLNEKIFDYFFVIFYILYIKV